MQALVQVTRYNETTRKKVQGIIGKEKKTFICKHCNLPFPDDIRLFQHIQQTHPLHLQSGGHVSSTTVNENHTPENLSKKKKSWIRLLKTVFIQDRVQLMITLIRLKFLHMEMKCMICYNFWQTSKDM